MIPDPAFWSRVHKTDSCWVWTGAIDTSGYGVVRRAGVLLRAHRYSFALLVWGTYKSSDSTGERVLRHSCGNRRCVNPAHLSEGTQAENADDTRVQGKSTAGEKHAMCRLSRGQADEIRRLASTGVMSQQQIADSFGVARSLVSMIKNGRRRGSEVTA